MSREFIKDPWKYWTLVCRFLRSLSRSRSGIELKENIFISDISDLRLTCGGKPLQHQHSPGPRGESPSGSLTLSRMKYFHRQWYAWWDSCSMNIAHSVCQCQWNEFTFSLLSFCRSPHTLNGSQSVQLFPGRLKQTSPGDKKRSFDRIQELKYLPNQPIWTELLLFSPRQSGKTYHHTLKRFKIEKKTKDGILHLYQLSTWWPWGSRRSPSKPIALRL